VLIEIVGATPGAERLHSRARNTAAKIIQLRLEQYEYWRQRPQWHRRVASLAAMAAIGESLSDLVATGERRMETLVDRSASSRRALIDPVDLA